jgi:hypothetical protein
LVLFILLTHQAWGQKNIYAKQYKHLLYYPYQIKNENAKRQISKDQTIF